MLSARLATVQGRIRTACERAGRAPAGVRLIAVTKTVSVDVIREAMALGLCDLGENRVQDARLKQVRMANDELRIDQDQPPFDIRHSSLAIRPSSLTIGKVRWHLIGHLQRNKAKEAVRLFDAIHSVDSLELMAELERQASRVALGSRLKALGNSTSLEPACPERSRGGASSREPIEVFLQVNVSGEATKFGCRPDEAPALAQAILGCAHLKLAGLMTIAPQVGDPEQTRPVFRQLRQLRDELADAWHLSPVTLHLSMGMSQDFDVAIEEGADWVRIGTALFKDSE